MGAGNSSVHIRLVVCSLLILFGVFNERHLRRTLANYFNYYHRWRTHLTLEMDCPQPWSVQSTELGQVIKIPEIGGLYH